MPQQAVQTLFAYGSLRSGFKSPAYEYISRYFKLIGEGRVRGKLYDMGSYPAGIPTTEDHFIQGELYEANNVGEFSWAIGQLDDYEGVNVEPDEVQLFRRDLTEVYMRDGNKPAWVYWFNGDVQGKEMIESGDVIDYLRKRQRI